MQTKLILLLTDDFEPFNLQRVSDLPTVDELGAAGLIGNFDIDNAIFGGKNFEKQTIKRRC